MEIIPAIDLYKGKVVRFVKGDPSRSTVYSDNPVAVAKRWQNEGAKIIHIVDLSAALGESDNYKIIEDILEEIKICIEVGGGIRNIDIAARLLSKGVDRVIIGTKSLQAGFLEKLLNSFGPEKVAVSVDVKEGVVATKGWQEKSSIEPKDFIESILSKGVKWIIYTDISKDGTLAGIDFDSLKWLSMFKGANFIISGGISGLKDIHNFKSELPFVWGCICGKALYDGKLKLKEAFSTKGF